MTQRPIGTTLGLVCPSSPTLNPGGGGCKNCFMDGAGSTDGQTDGRGRLDLPTPQTTKKLFQYLDGTQGADGRRRRKVSKMPITT